jgi:drug/metabolite transporter (DMT)-like permease
MTSVVVMLLLTVSLNTVAQVSLKRGISMINEFNLHEILCLRSITRVLKNPFIVIWVATLLPSMVIWLKVISITELSFAYPFQSLNLVFISLGSMIFLKERITGRQGSGIFMILVGIILISRS